MSGVEAVSELSSGTPASSLVDSFDRSPGPAAGDEDTVAMTGFGALGEVGAETDGSLCTTIVDEGRSSGLAHRTNMVPLPRAKAIAAITPSTIGQRLVEGTVPRERDFEGTSPR